MTRLKFLPLIITLLIFSESFAQKEGIPAEKVFIHVDQPYYASGEEIRFSAFLISYQTYSLSKVSEVVNIILWDKDLKKIMQQKVFLENGLGHGTISLPKNLPTGDYLIIGYTNWMMNFEEQAYNKLPIKVFNSNDYPLVPNPSPKEPSVEFYPEGGSLISNRMNKVVFKINNQQQNFSGYIVNDRGDSVAVLSPYYQGYGSIDFFVNNSVNYIAKVNVDGEEKTVALGEGKNNTASLMMPKLNSENLIIGANIGSGLFGDKITLLIQNKGKVILGADRELKTPIEYFSVPENLLGSGLNQITLLDKANTVISERLIYNRVNLSDSINVEIVKQVDKPRKKVSLEFNGLDNTKLSASIGIPEYFEKSTVNQIDYGVNLFSEIDFFPPNSKFVDKLKDDTFLDIFLISQNLETFKIRPVDDTEINNSTIYESEQKNRIVLAGKISNIITEKPVIDTTMFVTISGTDNFIQIVDVDKNGHFTMDIPVLYGRANLIFKLVDVNEDEVNIKYEIFENSPIPKIEDFLNVSQIDINEVNKYLEFIKEKRVIDKVYFPDRVTTLDSIRYQNDYFNNYDLKLDYSEYIVLDDFAEIVKELIPNIEIYDEKVFFKVYDEKTGYFYERYESEPLVLIDGLPIFDTNEVLKLQPDKIKDIKIINNQYFLSGHFFDGVLEITTQEADYPLINTTNHYIYQLDAFQKTPKSNNTWEGAITNSGKDKLPFFESTPYWNPSVNTEDTINFLVPDGATNFIIELQGTDGKGDFVYHNQIISLGEK